MSTDVTQSDIDAAELYHLNSSNVRATPQQLPPDPETRPAVRRNYAGAPRVALPGADLEVALPLGATLAARRSLRDYDDRATLPLLALGKLLFASAGVTGTTTVENMSISARTYPSGGGLYPLEIYPVLQRVDGVTDGIYHYDPFTHELEQLRLGNFHDRFAAMTIGQAMLASANAILFVTATLERTMWKYGQRGYRYVWMEAGHLGQNVYLVATALGLAPVALGGFYDAEADALLGIGREEKTIYAVCIGLARS